MKEYELSVISTVAFYSKIKIKADSYEDAVEILFEHMDESDYQQGQFPDGIAELLKAEEENDEPSAEILEVEVDTADSDYDLLSDLQDEEEVE